MRNKATRVCWICGEMLPDDGAYSRRYCKECYKVRRRELDKAAYARRLAKQRANPTPEVQPLVNPEDRKYCRKCKYGNQSDSPYLCNYICYTGVSRKCKAGVGCDKRVLLNG